MRANLQTHELFFGRVVVMRPGDLPVNLAAAIPDSALICFGE